MRSNGGYSEVYLSDRKRNCSTAKNPWPSGRGCMFTVNEEWGSYMRQVIGRGSGRRGYSCLSCSVVPSPLHH